MNNAKDLWREVEQVQEIMHEVISKKGVNSPDAIRAIQVFRSKMQEYNDLIKQ
jgi:hypothetical protein